MEQMQFLTSNLHLIFVLSVFLAVVITYTLLANVTVLVAILRSRRDSHSNSITKLLMASLTTSDLILTAFVFPYLIVLINNGIWKLGQPLCTVWIYTNFSVCNISGWHVLALAVDKYLAIGYPLVYRSLTSGYGLIAASVCWLVPLTTLLLPAINGASDFQEQELSALTNYTMLCLSRFNGTFFTCYMSLVFFLPLAIAYVLYALIFLEIRRYIRRIPQHSKNCNSKQESSKDANSNIRPRSSTISLTDASFFTAFQKEDESTHKKCDRASACLPKHVKHQTKAICTILSIVALFTIFWIPTAVFFLILINSFSLTQGTFGFGVVPQSNIGLLILGAYWFSFFTAFLNPFIYYKMKSVRKQVKFLLCG